MEEYLELTYDREGIIIEQPPGAAQEVIPGHKLRSTKTLGVSP